MKLVVGLGNPGALYVWTRHNIGFISLDFWAITLHAKWADKPKWQAMVTETVMDGEKVLMLKPQAFYNKSGEVVQQVARFYKIAKSDILVVCDDFDLPFGEVRFRGSGSSGGNNGLASIIEHLGDDIKRLRVGTNNAMRQTVGDADFVLSKFTDEEKAALSTFLPQIVNQIKSNLL
jgi:PTH1 family peptidyl-tRNA hydrolase